MKNSYRRNNIGARTLRVAAFVSIALLAGAVFFIDTVSGGVVRGLAREGGSALWRAANSATAILGENAALSSKKALVEENIALRAALAERDEYIAQFDAIARENASLRALVNVAAAEKGITVPVLSSLSSSPYGTFVIGAGAIDGVLEGSVVLTPGGFVLGSVTSVSPHTALVKALFAPGNAVELVADGVAFRAEGQGGGNARATAPRDAAVRQHSTVIVPAYANRPAGVVGAVESASSSAATTLFINVPVNANALTYVYVVAR